MGGGGNGCSLGASGQAGTANTGGGGGGATFQQGGGAGPSGAGGSGIAIISYPGPQRGTGGNISNAAGNTIHTFITSGTFTA